jgi:hypothetical protein
MARDGGERHDERTAVNRQRRDQVRRHTLEYLGNLLHCCPDQRGQLYVDDTGRVINDDEQRFIVSICQQEGMRLIARAKRSKP